MRAATLRRAATALCLASGVASGLPIDLAAQVARCSSPFLVTGGFSWESYAGNLSVVTLPTVDPSDRATAAVGELGACGRALLVDRTDRSLELNLDGGLRQFAAMGFETRDYAPRELVSRASLTWGQRFEGLGMFTLRGAYRGRSVEDRPPMPLFLQPEYDSFRGIGSFAFAPLERVGLDALVEVEHSNYGAPASLPQLDLLDRWTRGAELGAQTSGDDWSVRFFAGYRRNHYERQSTGEPDDPFRRDRMVNVGASWQLRRSDAELLPIEAELGIEGTMNRSNSRRPEYDALSLTGSAFTVLPWWDVSVALNTLVTWKTYLLETSFLRLVPGEEADNASVVHLDLSRPLASNLNGTLRFGWTRAETDIGDSYYRRFGTSLLFNFRPGGL